MEIDSLKALLENENDLEFAVLIGSRADNTFRPESDWDIAVRWARGIDFMACLGKTENLRRKCAAALHTSEAYIDIIDIASARLAMKAVVAEDGIPLKGENSIEWSRYLTRTWRELEEYYWERLYAA